MRAGTRTRRDECFVRTNAARLGGHDPQPHGAALQRRHHVPVQPHQDYSGQLGYGIDGATPANGGVRVNTNPAGEVNDIRSELTNGSFRPERFFNSRGTTAHYWDWTVPTNAQIGDTFTYFCRVHPFMRGSVQVVEEA